MKKIILSILILMTSTSWSQELSNELSIYAREGAHRLVREFKLADLEKAVLFDYNKNLVHLIHFERQGQELVVLKTYIASGGRGGVSNRMKSGGTSGGVHKIFKMQGHNFAENQTFDASKYGYVETRVTPTQGFEDWKSDFVMTRILRLQGLEGEFNNNAVKRSILFHGTQEEGMLGYSESAGCIRMKNREVIELFDQVKVGTLVNVVYSQTEAHRLPRQKAISYDESKNPELRRSR